MIEPLHLDGAFAGEAAKEVKTILADENRKLVAIRLREGAVLAAHHAIWPITIHCVDGRGELTVGEQKVALSRGVIVPLDPHVVHEVSGSPDVTLLVTMFRRK